MYDVEGSDTGAEWIEIYNNGSNAIDVSTWHFYEAETHHGLIPDGFSELGAEDYALIVQDVEGARSRYGSSLKLIKSSFSLNNTGETLAMSDEEKNITGSISYSVDDGANGNGMSLQGQGNTWIQAGPTPGAVNETQGEGTTPTENDNYSDNDDESSSNNQQTPSVNRKKEDIDYYEGFVIFGEQRFAQSPVDFEVFVEHTENKKTTKLKKGHFYVNFGDGNSFRHEERFTTEHIYEYPGTYEVTFEFYHRGALLTEQKPDVFLRKTIEIKPNQLKLDVGDYQEIIINNDTGGDINIEGWSIKTFGQTYTFPPYSYLKKGTKITLALETHTLSSIYKNAPVGLYNGRGEEVFSYPRDTIKKKTVSTKISPSSVSSTVASSNGLPTVAIETSHLEEFLVQHPNKHEVTFPSYQELFGEENDNHQDNELSPGSTLPLWIVIGVGILASFLGILRMLHLQQKQKMSEKEELPPIELIE